MIFRFLHRLWDWKEGGLRYRTCQQLNQLAKASREELVDHQRQQLRLLFDALRDTPYYQSIIRERAIDLSGDPLDVLTQFPILTKQDIRTNADALLNPHINVGEHCHAKTGGSTGVSLNLTFDRRCQKKRNGAQMFADSFANWQAGDWVAAVWGNPPTATTFKQKLRRRLLERTIYLDTMQLNLESVLRFAAEWQKVKPKVLFGHAHSIYLLATLVRDHNIQGMKPQGIVSTSMMLLQHERDTIEQVFGCKVTNRYGCEEVGLIAVECEQHHGLHLNSAHLIVECLNDEAKPQAKGLPGKLVVTDLNNLAMPLIRYSLEDVGVLSDRQCCCGSSFPLLEKIEGRIADFLKKSDGSWVAGVSLIERTLTNIDGIEQLQLIQIAIDKLIAKRVKGADYGAETDTLLTRELQNVFGDLVEIVIEDTDNIAQEANGKYRFSICKI